MRRPCCLLFMVLFFFSSGTLSLAEDNSGGKAAEEGKKIMENIKQMFESPYSEEDYYRADRLIVAATGSQLPVHKAPAVASIITAEEIEKMGATNLDEILETVSGVHVGPSFTTSYVTTYHMRGIYTAQNQQILVLVDGIPINTIYSNRRQISFRMPVAAISRLEIIRGPGSAVHGADAFAGTINIITKDVHELEKFRSGIRAGSFDTYDAWAQGGGTWRGWELAASIEYQESRGDRDRVIDSDQQTVFDTLFGTDASVAPGPMDFKYKFLDTHLALRKDNWNFRLWNWTNLGEGVYGAGVTNALTEGNELDMESHLADISYSNRDFAENWELDANLSYLQSRSDFELVLFPRGSVLPVGADGNLFTGANMVSFPDGVIGSPERTERTLSADLSGIYSGFNRHRLRFGAGAKHMELDSREFKNFGPSVIDGTEGIVDGTTANLSGTPYVYIPDESRKLWFLSLQDEWSLGKKWDLTAGVRYDHYSDFGSTVNPRVALVWETRYDLTTKLLYGTAFRPPSFQELYVQNNPASKGNEGLDPEKIQTLELAFDYQPLRNLHAVFNIFAYEVEDFIELVPDSFGSGKTFQNIRDQEGYGFEFEIDWEMTDTLRLRTNLAWQHSEDKDSGDPVPNTPRLQFFLNPHWNFLPDWSLDAQLNWVGDRKRAKGDSRSDIDDYTLVGLTLRRKNIARHWDLALSARNLFDEDAREPAGSAVPDDFPMPGRSFYVELRCRY